MKERHPGLPLVLVGHSMGGMIGARYAQRHGDELSGLVLSGPVLGTWTAATDMLALDEIPDDPLDVSTLSRDPAVGEVYAADELVWHGPFKRTTLEALDAGLRTINDGPKLGDAADALGPRRGRPARPARRDPRRDRDARVHRARGGHLPRRPPRGLQRDQQATRSSGGSRTSSTA